MFITDIISITELSRLTQKSRPTLYKYISDYKRGNYDDIPYSMIELFKLSHQCAKSDIVEYCERIYGSSRQGEDKKKQELICMINSIDEDSKIDRIKRFILEEIKND